jgi:hypothetical protein
LSDDNTKLYQMVTYDNTKHVITILTSFLVGKKQDILLVSYQVSMHCWRKKPKHQYEDTV